MTKSPPLAAIRAFEAVGRTGSVKRAAAELGVTSGAITQHVHSLESHLKRRLVQRNGRGIELTVWGRLYLPRLVSGFEELRKAEEDIERAGQTSHLIISTYPSLATKWLSTLVFAWKKKNSGARATIVGVHPEPRLDEAEADFRISYGNRHRHHARYLRLFTDRVMVVASPELLKRVGRLKHPSQLLKQQLLWVEWSNEYLALPSWPDWFAAAGVEDADLRPDLIFSLPGASVDAAVEGQGFALAQYSLAASALALGMLVQVFPLELPLSEAHFLAWSSTALEKPHGAAFHSWLIGESRRFDRIQTKRPP
jgi:LysR family transcriptional regulator, glycine cleavage system transcriptional activator